VPLAVADAGTLDHERPEPPPPLDTNSQTLPVHLYVRPFCVLVWLTDGEDGNESGMS
jgi:hypothetical protein